jgi:hypothetical protein
MPTESTAIRVFRPGRVWMAIPWVITIGCATTLGDVAKLEQRQDIGGLIAILGTGKQNDFSYAAREENTVRLEAAKSLSRLGDKAVPQLIGVLRTSPSPASRAFASYALGLVGPAAKEAIPALVVWNRVLSVEDTSLFVMARPHAMVTTHVPATPAVAYRVSVSGVDQGTIHTSAESERTYSSGLITPAFLALERITGEMTTKGMGWLQVWQKLDPRCIEALKENASDACAECSNEFKDVSREALCTLLPIPALAADVDPRQAIALLNSYLQNCSAPGWSAHSSTAGGLTFRHADRDGTEVFSANATATITYGCGYSRPADPDYRGPWMCAVDLAAGGKVLGARRIPFHTERMTKAAAEILRATTGASIRQVSGWVAEGCPGMISGRCKDANAD